MAVCLQVVFLQTSTIHLGIFGVQTLALIVSTHVINLNQLESDKILW